MQANQLAPTQLATPAAASVVTEDGQVVARQKELILYSHSNLFYYWPVWVVGFILSAVTYSADTPVQVGDNWVWFHPNSNLGVAFLATLFLVILITNIEVRGLASALVIVTAILVMVTLAYYDLWNPILMWLGGLQVQINLGAYFWFSVLMFIAWCVSVFIVDRFSYWRVTPGQITENHLFGAASNSFDTENLVLEKHRDDIFRHWVLGLGSGDLVFRPHGARNEEHSVPNVLFIGSKLKRIQHLIATEPAEPVVIQ